MARDAGTKIDQPSDQEGQGPDPKVAKAAEDSAQAVAQEQAEAAAEAPKPKRKRKPAVKKSEGTAAAETGVDKAGAEAALEGAEAPGDAEKAEAEAEAKPKPKPRARRKPGAKESAQPEPAPRPARRRRGSTEPAVTVRATARYVRSSPRKARLLTEQIRGKSVDEARAILAFSPRSVSEAWRKLLESAVANAENNHDLVGDDLRVLNATADDGPTLKRFRPRAMGRATRIRKRTSHLTITLTPKE
jgi:ribosomal protein L22